MGASGSTRRRRDPGVEWVGSTWRPPARRSTHMPTTGRVEPWLTLSVAQGKAVQVGGMLGAATLAWPAGRRGTGCARWMVLSRLLAYFSEHAFSHWLVGRALGIRFTGYGLHGTSHPRSYPPGALRVLVPPLPERAPRPSVARGGRACGTRGDVRGRHRRDRDPEPCSPGLLPPTRRAGGRGFFVGANLWSVPLLLSEALRPGRDLRRAWLGNSVRPPRHASSDSTF